MTDINASTAGQLKAFIERIERLDDERRAITDDIKSVYQEAKSAGFDGKILRKIVSLRRKDASERREEATLMEMYKHALGMEI